MTARAPRPLRRTDRVSPRPGRRARRPTDFAAHGDQEHTVRALPNLCRWAAGGTLGEIVEVSGRWGSPRADRQLGDDELEKSIYEKYGGFSAISRIVMSLYERLLDDDDIGPFFDDVDMPKLMDHQTKFVASLMGGPASFSDTHITAAHRHLTITPHQFDRLKDLVRETLEEFGFEEDDTIAVLGQFEIRRDLLVKD